MSRGNYFLNDPTVVFEHGHPIVSETNSGFLSKEIYRDFRAAALSNKYWNFFTASAAFGLDYVTGDTYVSGKIPCYLNDFLTVSYVDNGELTETRGFITVPEGAGLTVFKYDATTDTTYSNQWIESKPNHVFLEDEKINSRLHGLLIEPSSANVDQAGFADISKWTGDGVTLTLNNAAGLINPASVDLNVLDQSIVLSEISGTVQKHRATRVIPKTFSGEPLTISFYVKLPSKEKFKGLLIKILNIVISGSFSSNECFIRRDEVTGTVVISTSTPSVAQIQHINHDWVRVEIANEYIVGTNPVIELTSIWQELLATDQGAWMADTFNSALSPGNIEIAGLQIESSPKASSYVYPATWINAQCTARYRTSSFIPIKTQISNTVYQNPTVSYLNPYQGTILLTESSEQTFSLKMSLLGINGEMVNLYSDDTRVYLEAFVGNVSKETTGYVSRFPASRTTRTHVIQWDLTKTGQEITHKILEMTNGSSQATIKGMLTTHLSLQHPDLSTLLENGFEKITFDEALPLGAPKQIGMQIHRLYGFTSVLPDELTESVLRLTFYK